MTEDAKVFAIQGFCKDLLEVREALKGAKYKITPLHWNL